MTRFAGETQPAPSMERKNAAPRHGILRAVRFLGLPILLSLCACASEYDVRVSFESPDLRERSTRVGVAVVQSCTDADIEGTLRAVVQDVEFGIDEAAGPLGTLDPGTYGLLARAWNDECEIIAAACRPITIESGGSQVLSIQMLGRSGQRCAPGRQCSQGVCDGSSDAGADVGSDVGSDVGNDSGADASTDVGTDSGMDTGPIERDAGQDAGDAGDAGPDVGPGTFCARHGAGSYACLDFESEPGRDGWTLDAEGTGMFSEAEGAGVTGSGARISGGNDGSAAIRHDGRGPHTTGTMWLRARVFVPATSVGNLEFMNLFAIHDPDSAPFPYLTVSLTGGRGLIMALDSTTASTSDAQQFPVEGDGFCVELEFDNTDDGTMVLYMDGTELLRENVAGGSVWSTVWVGARGIGVGQAQASYLMDDFVWSTTRVPCTL